MERKAIEREEKETKRRRLETFEEQKRSIIIKDYLNVGRNIRNVACYLQRVQGYPFFCLDISFLLFSCMLVFGLKQNLAKKTSRNRSSSVPFPLSLSSTKRSHILRLISSLSGSWPGAGCIFSFSFCQFPTCHAKQKMKQHGASKQQHQTAKLSVSLHDRFFCPHSPASKNRLSSWSNYIFSRLFRNS